MVKTQTTKKRLFIRFTGNWEGVGIVPKIALELCLTYVVTGYTGRV